MFAAYLFCIDTTYRSAVVERDSGYPGSKSLMACFNNDSGYKFFIVTAILMDLCFSYIYFDLIVLF